MVGVFLIQTLQVALLIQGAYILNLKWSEYSVLRS